MAESDERIYHKLENIKFRHKHAQKKEKKKAELRKFHFSENSIRKRPTFVNIIRNNIVLLIGNVPK